MLCEFCNRECKNDNSYKQHRIRCKNNPNALIIKSSFIAYNEKLKTGEIVKTFGNQFSKAKKLGLEKPIITEETRKKLSKGGKKQIWSEERREKHSKIMAEIAKNNPDVYSNKQKRNIQEYKGCKFDSSWELEVAKYFDKNNIKWERVKIPIPYLWRNKWHSYYPDFYLKDLDFFVEVKGYQIPKDEAKWNSLTNLVVIKKEEIKLIKKDNFGPLSPRTHNA